MIDFVWLSLWAKVQTQTDANAGAEKHGEPRHVVESRLLVIFAKLELSEARKAHVYNKGHPNILCIARMT